MGQSTMHTASVTHVPHLYIAFLFLLTLSACDSGSDPLLLQVEGTYKGHMVSQVSTVEGDLTRFFPAQFEVVQAGATVTISGTMYLVRDVVDLAAITGEINATGLFTPTAGGSVREYTDPNCGQLTTTSESFVFSGDSLHVQETYITADCGDVSASGMFAREK